MASAIEEYRKKFGTQAKAQPSAITEYRERQAATKTSQPVSAVSQFRNQTSSTTPIKAKQKQLNSADDLYKIATKAGLQRQADALLSRQQGESTKQIFSGGFISDIFDVLNALQYGVVGVAKGKSFAEGVRTRQSFTDDDALGDKGIPGLIAGIALDIAFDPLTYIAPATILKKIPFATKLAKASKAAVFGKRVEKAIDAGGDVARATETIGRHLKSAGDVLSFTPKADIEKMGGVKALLESAKNNIVMALKAENLGDASRAVEKIDASKFSKLDDFKKAINVGRHYETLEGGTRLGKYLGSKFTYMFGADPIFRETFERSTKNVVQSTMNIADMAKSVSKIDPAIAKQILTKDATGRFARVPFNNLPDVLKSNPVVQQFYKTIDDLGQQAVDLGLLSKETFEANLGNYVKNAYMEYEKMGKGSFQGLRKGIKGIFSRKPGLTAERMAELGQIDNPAYLLFKSAFDLTRDVENAKLYKKVAENFASNVAQDGFKKVAGKNLGALAGKYIPEHMASYIDEIANPSTNTIAKELVANFKFFKVIMNPATHARNMASNTLLNWWKLGMGPWRADLYAQAFKQVKHGGKFLDEAKQVGYGLDTFAAAEMKGLLDSPEALGFGKKIGSKWAKVKKSLGDLYQSEENIAKMAAFIHQRGKGLDPEAAWKAAESATFNYAQVTPFVRKLRESLFGFPFITFTVKSTPAVIETALKNPARISAIGKIKNTIEKAAGLDEAEKERASEPSWVKNGFYVKLPMKDKFGRSAYFDLTYILPFGDLVSGQFFERGEDMESGTPESLPKAAMRKSPFFSLIGELGRNKDFYGNSIWKNSDSPEKQLADLFRHVTKTYIPPALSEQLPGGYNEKGERQYRGIKGASEASDENQKRTYMEELLRHVGAKVQPIDADIQETYQEWNRRKALESLLLENGILSSFERTYVPKKKK